MEPSLQFHLLPFDRLTVHQLLAIARLRQQVFYLEQQVDCPDWDETDPRSVFLWAEADGAAVGFLRIIPPGVVYAEASVGRVAVDAAWRRRGVARRMMTEALRYIDAHWGSAVRISSQEYIVPLYEQLGFEVISERYTEAGIPHRKMIRK